MSNKPILDYVLAVMRAHPGLQDFGQAHSGSAWNGVTACTHVCCQMLYLVWKKKLITIDEVNTLAGMPYRARNIHGEPRGMRPAEMAHFFAKTGLPYVMRIDRTFEQLMRYSDHGPVAYSMRYGTAPEWHGFHYQGVTASAPFARPDRHAGKTQLRGFENGAHEVTLLGYLTVTSGGLVVRRDAYRKDPNHGSASRPERPPYDIIKTTEAKAEYLDYHRRLGRTLIAAVPTRTLPL